MGRPQISVAKRQREQAKRDKKQMKAEKKAQRTRDAATQPDESEEIQIEDNTLG